MARTLMTPSAAPAMLIERFGRDRILAIRGEWLAFIASQGPRPDLEDEPRVATCPVCSAWWSTTTAASWWRYYVCCYSCARQLLGVDRALSDQEMAASFAAPTVNDPAGPPGQLTLFGC